MRWKPSSSAEDKLVFSEKKLWRAKEFVHSSEMLDCIPHIEKVSLTPYDDRLAGWQHLMVLLGEFLTVMKDYDAPNGRFVVDIDNPLLTRDACTTFNKIIDESTVDFDVHMTVHKRPVRLGPGEKVVVGPRTTKLTCHATSDEDDFRAWLNFDNATALQSLDLNYDIKPTKRFGKRPRFPAFNLKLLLEPLGCALDSLKELRVSNIYFMLNTSCTFENWRLPNLERFEAVRFRPKDKRHRDEKKGFPKQLCGSDNIHVILSNSDSLRKAFKFPKTATIKRYALPPVVPPRHPGLEVIFTILHRLHRILERKIQWVCSAAPVARTRSLEFLLGRMALRTLFATVVIVLECSKREKVLEFEMIGHGLSILPCIPFQNIPQDGQFNISHHSIVFLFLTI